MLKNKLAFALIFILTITFVTAQNNTNSPYSQYGYGVLDDNSFGMGRGMGGIGYGLRSSKQINTMNPASYAAMDSLTFLFDIGANVQNTWMKQGDMKETFLNGNLEYIALQFPLSRRLAMSAGLLPFSFVGYNYQKYIDNGTINRFGEGGLSQAYLGLGANVYKGLSLGVNISYLFGNIDNYNYVIGSAVPSSLFQTQLHASDFRIQLAMQYTQELDKKNKMTFGFVYTPQKALLGRVKEYEVDYSGDGSSVETASYSSKSKYELPASYGAGVTYSYDNKLVVGLDYLFQNWSNVVFENQTGVKFTDRTRVALGASYTPSLIDRRYYNRMSYRAGVFYNRSYLEVKNNKTNEYGVSCGFGLPIKSDKSMINVALEYVRKQNANQQLITEDYIRFSFSLTFNERWFQKFKFH